MEPENRQEIKNRGYERRKSTESRRAGAKIKSKEQRAKAE